MASYENTLTSSARRLHEAAAKMVLDMLDQLQAMGFSEDAMRDQQRRGQMWSAIRDAWSQVNLQLLEKAADALGWEEFVWRGAPFAFHVRSHPKRAQPGLLDSHYERARALLDGEGSAAAPR